MAINHNYDYKNVPRRNVDGSKVFDISFDTMYYNIVAMKSIAINGAACRNPLLYNYYLKYRKPTRLSNLSRKCHFQLIITKHIVSEQYPVSYSFNNNNNITDNNIRGDKVKCAHCREGSGSKFIVFIK